MLSRVGYFLLGAISVLVALVVGGYLFVRAGGIPMAATAKPLPLEKRVARLALRASLGHAAALRDPLAISEENMLAGARLYGDHCAGCHGSPGRPRPGNAAVMFPPPPQLFDKRGMVTDDPEGVTYWKVTNGIRLSGMPAFGSALSDTQRWQVTMVLAHADQLPSSVRAAIAGEAGEGEEIPR